MSRRSLVGLVVLVGLPVLGELVLVEWLAATQAAGVMLGAVAGASEVAVLATIAALLLRVYCLVVLPGLVASALAVRVARGR